MNQVRPDNGQPETAIRIEISNSIAGFDQVRGDIERCRPSWLDERFAETGVIVALPRIKELAWADIMGIKPQEFDAEIVLSSACSATGMLGLNPIGFVNSPFLTKQPSISSETIRSMADLGWTQSMIDGIESTLRVGVEFRHRTLGAAGWLVCNHTFLTDRSRLRNAWSQLPQSDRPWLPLERSPHLSSPPAGARKRRANATTSFQREFDGFCDRWRILKMITWELPQPDGPKWTEDFPGKPPTMEGADCFDTPFHFPVRNDDELGRRVVERHGSRAQQHGFVDQRQWQTYARLLEIGFWENVLDSRYGKRRSKRIARSSVDGLLSELLKLAEERVTKLRKVLHQFRNGRRTSLSDFR